MINTASICSQTCCTGGEHTMKTTTAVDENLPDMIQMFKCVVLVISLLIN